MSIPLPVIMLTQINNSVPARNRYSCIIYLKWKISIVINAKTHKQKNHTNESTYYLHISFWRLHQLSSKEFRCWRYCRNIWLSPYCNIASLTMQNIKSTMNIEQVTYFSEMTRVKTVHVNLMVMLRSGHVSTTKVLSVCTDTSWPAITYPRIYRFLCNLVGTLESEKEDSTNIVNETSTPSTIL